MKKLLLIISFLSTITSFSQDVDYDKLCKNDFWRDVDSLSFDTLTVFKSNSLCIKELPRSVYNLKKLKKLTLGTATDFEIISSNIKKLSELENVHIAKSKLILLPDEICKLINLKHLTIAWGGQLEKLPENIGDLKNLETLDLYRNKLTRLPHSIQKLTKLKLLRLGENNFSNAEKERIKTMLPNCKITF